MSPTDREEALRRERSKALVRALHIGELQAAGARRALALDEAEEQLDRIARLLPDALRGGLTITEIGRVTGISRPTLYELKARYGDEVGDLRFGVLQAVIMGTGLDDDIAERLKRKSSEVSDVLRELRHEGLVDIEPYETADGIESEYHMTPKGMDALEDWQFEYDRPDDGGESKGAQT
jgi:DNA-binding MarR family transcriptional regulator